MPSLTKNYRIKERDFVRAGDASIQVQSLLKSLGLDSRLIRRIAICSYEAEMNVVMHGEDGCLTLDIHREKIVLDITDRGPGISDIEKAMTVGFSTAPEEFRRMGFGAGMGLPNMKNNADRLTIASTVGEGTSVRMIFRTEAGGDGSR